MVRLIPFILSFLSVSVSSAKELSLSFDDSPRLRSPKFGAKKRAEIIRKTLRDKKIKRAIFFATPKKLDEETREILEDHSKAGHLIGNHTHSHLSLNDIEAKPYIEDIRIAHGFLSSISGFIPFFRHPYLRQGETKAKHDQVWSAIKGMGYSHGYVTIDNSEWVLEHGFVKAYSSGKKIDYHLLGKLYVNHLLEEARFFDKISKKWLGRSVKHTLLLHENEMAAMYLGDLIDALREGGWKIITATESYKDPLSKMTPKTLHLNQGRVMALAIDKGYKGPKSSPKENYRVTKKRLEESGVFD